MNTRKKTARVLFGLAAGLILLTASAESAWAQQAPSAKKPVAWRELGLNGTPALERTTAAADRAVVRINVSKLDVRSSNMGDMGAANIGFYNVQYPWPDGSGSIDFIWTNSMALAVGPGTYFADAQVHESGDDWQSLSVADWEAADGSRGTLFADPPEYFGSFPMAAHSNNEATWPAGGWPAPTGVSEVWWGADSWDKWDRKADLESYVEFDDKGASRNPYSSVLNISARKRLLGYSSTDAVYFQVELTNNSSNTYLDCYIGQFADMGGPVINSWVGWMDFDVNYQMMFTVGDHYNAAAGTHDDDDGRQAPWFGYVFLESPTGSFKKDAGGVLVDNPDQVLTRVALTHWNDMVGGSDPTLYGALSGDVSYLNSTEAQALWKTDAAKQNPVYVQDAADWLSMYSAGNGDSDPASYVSSGPFDFGPGETINYCVAYVAGQTELAMYSAADLAVKTYQAKFAASGPPPSPSLGGNGFVAGPAGATFNPDIHSYPVHYAPSGSVTIFWDGEASELALDSVTGDQDFEGFRVYRSTDRGRTWGEPITDTEGKPIGYTPVAQFDLNNSITGPDPNLSGRHLGDDTGLAHSYTDTAVLDGYEYWYAVTAYDYAPPDPSYESAISGDPSGNNVIAVIAGASPPGYVPGAVGTGASAGGELVLFTPTDPDKGTTISVRVVNDRAITGDSYRLDLTDYFVDGAGVTQTYRGGLLLRNTIDGVDFFEDPVRGTETAFGDDNVPVTEGFQIITSQPAGGNAGAYQLTQTVETDPDTSYSGTDFYVAPQAYMEAESDEANRGNFNQDFSDYEMRFVDSWPYNPASTDTNWCVDYIMEDWVPVPFELWNITTNTRIFPVIYDYGIYNVMGYGSYYGNLGEWDGIDITVFTTVPYWEDEGAGIVTDFLALHPFTDADYWGYDPSSPLSRHDWLYRWGFGEEDGTYDLWDPGDIWRLETNKPVAAYAGQSFTFSTTASSVDDAEVTLDDIEVVPNPYYIFAEWDQSVNRRKIQFQNVPAGATVDIYTLSGELVASLAHNSDYNADKIGTVDWNLWTYEFTEAAYGLYIYVVKTTDGDKKIGKFAIIR